MRCRSCTDRMAITLLLISCHLGFVKAGWAAEGDPGSRSGLGPAAFTASKRGLDLSGGPGRWYGTAELRHHLDTYYAPAGRVDHQEPTVHARLQVGAQFYDGAVDAYATLGAFKAPRSQQILQRRPEVALDLYPVRTEILTLLQYTYGQIPVRRADNGGRPDEINDSYNDATVTVLGLNPMVKWPLLRGASKFDGRFGADLWTKFYSRPQRREAAPPIDDDLDKGHLALVDSPSKSSDPASSNSDYALHYQSDLTAGLSLSPQALKEFSAEATLHFHSRFEPEYVSSDGHEAVHYGAKRDSFYQLRLQYELSDRLVLTNDFYHFYDGLLASERRSDTGFRFRNVARIGCRL